ncbi:MAG: hypothetical protein ACR2OR_13785 [Hyphomicrobiales bacterium]
MKRSFFILIPVLAFVLLFEPAFATKKCALAFFRSDRGKTAILHLQRVVLASAASLLSKNAVCVNEVDWQNLGESLRSVDLKNERKREREFRSLFTAATYLVASGNVQRARNVLNILAQRTTQQLTSNVDEMRNDAVFDLLTVCTAMLKTGNREIAKKCGDVSFAAAWSLAKEEAVKNPGASASLPAASQFVEFFRSAGETSEVELMLTNLERLKRSATAISDEDRVWNNADLAIFAIQAGLTEKAWGYLENAQEILQAKESDNFCHLNILILAKIAASAGIGKTGGRYLNDFHKCALETDDLCLNAIWKVGLASDGGEVRIFDFLGTLLWFHTSKEDRESALLVQEFATIKLNRVSEAKDRLALLMVVIAPPGVREDKALHNGLASKIISKTILSDLSEFSGVRFQALSLVQFLLASGEKTSALAAVTLMRQLFGAASDANAKDSNVLELARAIGIAANSPALQIGDILFAKLHTLIGLNLTVDHEEFAVFTLIEAMLNAGHSERASFLAKKAIEKTSAGRFDTLAGLLIASAFAHERRGLPMIGETGILSGLTSAFSLPVGARGPTIQ